VSGVIGHMTAMPVTTPTILVAAATALGGAGLETRVDVAEAVCLAVNVYHESKSEPVEGQRAVAFVTVNRAADPRFPDSICGVVTQRQGGSCQFGWYCDGRPDEPQNQRQFRQALRVAIDVLSGEVRDNTRGAQYFVSSKRATPSWAKRLRETVTIAGHRFLRS
jgi:spore germination cell wall hydrolase CwlJ-like protein